MCQSIWILQYDGRKERNLSPWQHNSLCFSARTRTAAPPRGRRNTDSVMKFEHQVDQSVSLLCIQDYRGETEDSGCEAKRRWKGEKRRKSKMETLNSMWGKKQHKNVTLSSLSKKKTPYHIEKEDCKIKTKLKWCSALLSTCTTFHVGT